ncbi:rRNA biogenesis protein [Yarrowia sp. C11]|nr:rRNA biogenesis protein [Yarrowia sp. C11]KAG5363962.1 rRNA biogenesis protein [Yarrowia sp. E02]
MKRDSNRNLVRKRADDSDSDEYNTFAGQESDSGPEEMSSLSFGAIRNAQKNLDREGQDNSDDSDSDSGPEESSGGYERGSYKGKGKGKGDNNKDEGGPKKRLKHAPSEASSKKRVSVIRPIPGLTMTKSGADSASRDSRLYRDIRFDATYGKANEDRVREDYAFLDDYRREEIAELQAKLKKTEESYVRAQIQTQIQSLQSKLKTLEKRDFRKKVLNDHRQQQREQAKDGKNPYYLKRSEQRKLVLTEQFKTMKKKDIDRAIERRRKKITGKEKKDMFAGRE